MAACCHDLLPCMDLMNKVGDFVWLKNKNPIQMFITICEENSGALVLAETLPHAYTPFIKCFLPIQAGFGTNQHAWY